MSRYWFLKHRSLRTYFECFGLLYQFDCNDHDACVYVSVVVLRSKLQINKQCQKYLLALNPIQNNVCDRGGTI